MIARELSRAMARRHALGLPQAHTTVYRLLHGASDGVDGLTVDVYDRWLVASLYTEQTGTREQAWLAALGELGFEGVYLKQRPRQANALSQAERQARAPEHAVIGRDAPDPLVVREHGVPFEVRLGDGFSTGLFLDQRDNRQRVQQQAHGARVLNLFAYTCAFGVVAARAGAACTTNIDLSRSALTRGKRNYQRADIASGQHGFWARDVLETLPKLARRGERFDLIVLDPPSYASAPGGRFRVERDVGGLARHAFALLEQGGSLLACANHHRMTEGDLSTALQRAARAAGRTLRALTLYPPPADFPGPLGRPAHLKSAWAQV